MLERLKRLRRDVGSAARTRMGGAGRRPPAEHAHGAPAAEGRHPLEQAAAAEHRPIAGEHRPGTAEHRPAAGAPHPDEGRHPDHDRHRDEARRADGEPHAHAGTPHGGTAAATGAAAGAATTDRDRHVTDRDRHLRARDEFGGFNIGAAFFGWLVAVGLAALLVALLSAAGAATGLTDEADRAARSSGTAETVGIVGGVLLLVVLLLAYFAGGYVAGRMSRFDGARQGVGVWLLGLLMTVALAILAAVAGEEYNVLDQLNLPRVPVDEGSLTTGGIIALAAIVLGTLLAALIGGKAGERYHRKVDRAGGIPY